MSLGPQFSSNPNLSARFKDMSSPVSAYDWVDYDKLPDVLHFVAERKDGTEGNPADNRWVESPITGKSINIRVETANPKTTRHSPSKGYGGFIPVVTEHNDVASDQEVQSHKEYKEIVGDPLDTSNAPDASVWFKDLMPEVHKARPNFPKVFPTLARAQFVAEAVAHRAMMGKPFGPRGR